MKDVPLALTCREGAALRDWPVEQGIPVAPMDPEQVGSLRLMDSRGRPVPASIEPDGRDENGRVVWVRLAAAPAVDADGRAGFVLGLRPDLPEAGPALGVTQRGGTVEVTSPGHYVVRAGSRGTLRIERDGAALVDGPVDFQLWPDARSIIGGGGGTCRLASFQSAGWSVEERSARRCLLLLTGRVPRFRPYTSDPCDFDPEEGFDCELELILYAFSPVIRLRWRIVNQTGWQAFLERYALSLRLAESPLSVQSGDPAVEGGLAPWIACACPAGALTLACGFARELGAGAGASLEREEGFEGATADRIAALPGRPFMPHRYLQQMTGPGRGVRLVCGGIAPPHDGRMTTANPAVHRLFYRGMGRTFEGWLAVGAQATDAGTCPSPRYFTVPAQHYSDTGTLPEGGDPVTSGEFRDAVQRCADWLLERQWTGTLWWGEWWREWDTLREQGVEATANANNALAPLFHYWRTGDERFAVCARRAMEFAFDIQLNHYRGNIAPFFHSRRFLMDQMEWVHMRYQRIDGVIRAAHFFGDRRVRARTIEAMRRYAQAMVCPDGAPGFAEGGPIRGRRVRAGADCTNFGEVLGICYRETGDPFFLRTARKMAGWIIRHMRSWDWEKDAGNSYGWHFLMRGMLQTVKLTGSKRYRDWYLDMARRNVSYPLEQIDFRCWMCWLLAEAHRLGGERWILDEALERTRRVLQRLSPTGALRDEVGPPWSKWPTIWERLYDQKTVVAYVPVLAARLAAGGER